VDVNPEAQAQAGRCSEAPATAAAAASPAGAAPPNFRYTSAVVTNQNTGRSDSWPMG
jgi:hypothetical protein